MVVRGTGAGTAAVAAHENSGSGPVPGDQSVTDRADGLQQSRVVQNSRLHRDCFFQYFRDGSHVCAFQKKLYFELAEYGYVTAPRNAP